MNPNDAAVFWPALAMVTLTFVVMVVMYRRRVAQMVRERIHPQAVSTSARASALLTDCAAADNFRNLFELPVLFYLAVVVAAVTAQADAVMLGLAWAFVALRVAHSAIHCSYNKVMHRFRVFLAGASVLVLLWLWLGWRLLSA